MTVTDGSSPLWISRAEGVLTQKNDGTFTNEVFVDVIRSSDEPTALYLAPSFPTPITIRTVGDVPPSRWCKWDTNCAIDDSYVRRNIAQVPSDDYDAYQRLHMTRREVSQRLRSTAAAASFVISPRGYDYPSMPAHVNDALISVVCGLYGLVDKYTIATLSGAKTTSLSKDKKEKLRRVYQIVSRRRNVLDVALISAYTQPSSIIIHLFYCIASLYGVAVARAVVNDMYYATYCQQVTAICDTYRYVTEN